MLGQDRHADEAAAVAREEVHLFRGDEIRCEHEITLVLAVFVVHQDDDAAGANLADDLGDRADRGSFAAHGADYMPRRPPPRARGVRCGTRYSALPVSLSVLPVRSRMRADLPERLRR